MNHNPGIQNTGLIAWNGTTSFIRKIVDHVYYGFVFEVVTTLTADAIFKFNSHPPSDADPCVPGAATIVDEIQICQAPITSGADATFVIPNGTPAGTVCSVALACYPDEFISLQHVSGGANVRAVLILNGPKN